MKRIDRKAETIGITYDEADLINFVLDSYFDDSKQKLAFNIGTLSRVAFYRKLQRRIEAFVSISKRCGVTGPEDSKGDWPSCTLRPHPESIKHSYLDQGTQKEVRWFGDKSADYMEGLMKFANRKNSGITITSIKKRA